jgi:hypothetical protein
MLVLHDNGQVEYLAGGVSTVIVPADVLTVPERNAIRPLVAKLRNAGRAAIRARLLATATDLANPAPGDQ